jgi:hypothetical protein
MRFSVNGEKFLEICYVMVLKLNFFDFFRDMTQRILASIIQNINHLLNFGSKCLNQHLDIIVRLFL